VALANLRYINALNNNSNNNNCVIPIIMVCEFPKRSGDLVNCYICITYLRKDNQLGVDVAESQPCTSTQKCHYKMFKNDLAKKKSF